MTIAFKDYYRILGVSPKATSAEIKTAFRKLARLHHPDVAKDKSASDERFKEVNEANEVLSDPLKRQRYDALGERWNEAPAASGPGRNGFASHHPPEGTGPEFHFSGTGFSDFFEQYFGGGEGFGFDFGERGQEGAAYTPRRGADIEGDLLVTLEEVMHGTLRSLSLRTVDRGTGQVAERSFQVRVPAGALEGRRLRVAGKGAPGPGGGAPGDLYLRVRHAAHPDFHTRGADLVSDLELAPWEAVLGASIPCHSFEGTVTVRVPPATNDGKILRLRGRGLPKGKHGMRGDLLLHTHLRLPTELSREERSLWEQLGRTSSFHPREADTTRNPPS